MFRYIQPLQFLLTLLAGWIHRRQFDVIEYLKEENRLLKESLGGRRIRFTDAERRRLASLAPHARQQWAVGSSSIAAIHAGCPASNWYGASGYFVAAYADDQQRNQILAGLLAAKAAGQLISGQSTARGRTLAVFAL